MNAATQPVQRSPQGRLLAVSPDGRMVHGKRTRLMDHLAPGDLLVANDAATLPASLRGTHERTAREVEIRLAGRRSLDPEDVRGFTAVVFGEGDHRTPTENRPLPPQLQAGDVLNLGRLVARVRGLQGHPRLVTLAFEGSAEAVWEGLARHGRPVQYAHVREPLSLWDVWTRVAGPPVAFEPPSAGFILDWRLLAELRARGVAFATLTHAAGLSSTGDPVLDARLPLDEPYRIPASTVAAIAAARERGGRVIALGTTVTRALEHAARESGGLCPGPGVCPGGGLATLRIEAETELRVVDAIVTGTHEPGESHYELLRAFASNQLLAEMSTTLEEHGYRTHEFGDSVLLARQAPREQQAQGLPLPVLLRWGSIHQVMPLD